MRIIPKTKVECVHSERAILGESPVWSDVENCLYWVDIEGRRFNRFDPSSSQNLAVETTERFGCFALREQGGFVAATERGFKLYDPALNQLSALTDPETAKPHNRFNDGRCDRSGRFWAGSMVEHGAQVPEAALYCLAEDYTCQKKFEGVILANGLAWSPDNKTMYFADTRQPIVWAFDFDLARAALSGQRVFIEFGAADGVPDGAAIDSDGGYWLAQPRASRVCRYTPAGKLDTVIELPVTKPTMCAFGGRSLNTLYITTNSAGFSAEEMAAQPLAGTLLAVELTTTGLPEPKFSG